MYESERDIKTRQVVCNCYYCLRSMEKNTQNKQHENDVLIIDIYKSLEFSSFCAHFMSWWWRERILLLLSIYILICSIFHTFMTFIDNLKYKWKFCLHWTVPLWSLSYWYNICTKLLHLEAMWYEIKGKIIFRINKP